MGFAGRLEGIAPSDIFQIISQNRMTGTLIARCQEGTAMVVFKNGQVIEAASDAPEESLGALLVSQGVVTEGTIEAAEQRMKKESGQPLGALLVDMGAISEKTLEAVVMKQIENIVHRLVSCEDGFITFDRGETAVKRKINTREFLFPSGISTEFLMMEGARIIDEERRRGTDRRRSQAAGAPAGTRPDGELRRATDEHAGTGAAPQLDTIPSWFQSISFPSYAAFTEAEVDLYRKGRQIVRSAADRLKSALLPWFKTAWSKVAAFSPDGRAMMFVGIAGIAAGISVILLFSLSHQTIKGDLVITGRVVNLRAEPATSAAVVAKISQGETVTPVEFKDDWHQVKTKAGETGWVWKNLVEQQEKKGWAFSYRVTGFELLLLAGLALIVVGIMRRREGQET